MHRLPALGLTVASVLLTAGCGFVGASDKGIDKPGEFTLRGYASVAGASTGTPGTPCQAPVTVPGIVAGATVRVTDGAGAALGTGKLTAGVLAQAAGGYRCNFPFEVANVAGGPTTYTVLVADRPGVSFPALDLRQGEPAVVDVAGTTASTSPS